MSTAQQWDPENYAFNARFVSELGLPVVELLDPQPGERILDLGCGDGALTEKLAELGCHVVGVDGSAAQVAATRKRGLVAQVMDGQQLTFENEFDAVFSNAALHWMKQAEAVTAGVWRALKRGGRFVGEMGGRGNIDRITAVIYQALAKRGIDGTALNPWYFPAVEEYGELLAGQGFQVREITLIPRPTRLPGDITGWLETFAQSFIGSLAETERPGFLQEVHDSLEPVLRDDQGCWVADYVRLRFAADKP